MIIKSCNSKDALLLRNLAKQCKPLDIHTHYTYWIICKFFGDSCFIISNENNPIGYIMTIVKNNILFIWQIGILKEYRGNHYSKILLDSVKQYAINNNYSKILVSISPNNKSSYYTFQNYCNHNNLTIIKLNDYVDINDKDENFVEFEYLYEIILKD